MIPIKTTHARTKKGVEQTQTQVAAIFWRKVVRTYSLSISRNDKNYTGQERCKCKNFGRKSATSGS